MVYIFLRRIFQIDLVEHALAIVVGNVRQIFCQKSTALLGLSEQIGFVGNAVGTQSHLAAPQCAVVVRGRIGQHPVEQGEKFVEGVADGEEQSALHIGRSVVGSGGQHVLHCELVGRQPFRQRTPQESGGFRPNIAAESIVKAIGAQHKLPFAIGFDIYTLPRSELHLRFIDRYARHHIIFRQCPPRSNMRIFYPKVAVVVRQFHIHPCVLGEECGVFLHILLNDKTLVFHHILQSRRRTDHFGRRAEMVKLPSR